jgi:PPOX class probable F420-dependent enzyme
MPASATDRDAVKQFLAESNRAVLITHRKDGGIQASPMAVVADDEGNVLLATRAATAKVKNLARNPQAAVCLITERFLGAWMTVEGEAEIERLPEAMPALADFYRRRGSEDVEGDAFKERMRTEGRVLIRLKTQRIAQSATRQPPAAAQPAR